MNDKTKKYLDKVIEFIVEDTIIDYEQKIIRFPFLYLSYSTLSPPFCSLPYPLTPPPTFEKYCIDIYGLTEGEIDYVWKQYKDIIKDKINER